MSWLGNAFSIANLCEENLLCYTGFHSQKASIAELWCFHCHKPRHTFEQTAKLPVISDSMMLVWYDCNDRQYLLLCMSWMTTRVYELWLPGNHDLLESDQSKLINKHLWQAIIVTKIQIGVYQHVPSISWLANCSIFILTFFSLKGNWIFGNWNWPSWNKLSSFSCLFIWVVKSR